MKKQSAGTVRSPLKQQRINPAEIIAYRWVPADSQKHSKNQRVATAAVNMEFTVYILICMNHITVDPSAVLAFHLLCVLFLTKLQFLLV